MIENKRIIINSEKNFNYAKDELLKLCLPEKYSETWERTCNEKRPFYDYLSIFWLTPISHGIKELEENENDTFLRWMPTILQQLPKITELCRERKYNGSINFNIPMDRFLTNSAEDTRVSNIYNTLKQNTDIDFSYLPSPTPVGCIQYENIDGFFFNASSLKFLYQYWQIKKYAPSIFNKNKPTFLEIGAGYGGLAYQILSKEKNTNYTIIDLPDTLIVSMYFLWKNFPDRKIVLHLNNNSKLDINTDDINLIPNIFADIVKDKELDIAINSSSLLEMNNEDIQYYFNLIQDKNKVAHFYNFNREFREENGSIRHFKDFPYDPQWEDLLFTESDIGSYFLTRNKWKVMQRLTKRTT